jgi:hypothetical protein
VFDPGIKTDDHSSPPGSFQLLRGGLQGGGEFAEGLVEFAHYEPRDVLRAGVWTRTIGEPSWGPLDRETVETLVGERVD